jgi:hypothetical protein
MELLRCFGHQDQSITSWAHDAEQYDGSFLNQYRAGLDLLDEAQRACKSVRTTAVRCRALAMTLGVSTTFLAAAAGITVLPEGVSRWVSAMIAFLAAVISGLSTAIAPDRKARTAVALSVDWLHLRDDTHRYLRWMPTLPDGPDAKSASVDAIEAKLGRLQERRNEILTKAIADPAIPAFRSPEEGCAAT